MNFNQGLHFFLFDERRKTCNTLVLWDFHKEKGLDFLLELFTKIFQKVSSGLPLQLAPPPPPPAAMSATSTTRTPLVSPRTLLPRSACMYAPDQYLAILWHFDKRWS